MGFDARVFGSIMDTSLILLLQARSPSTIPHGYQFTLFHVIKESRLDGRNKASGKAAKIGNELAFVAAL